jgi:hypothetical protein
LLLEAKLLSLFVVASLITLVGGAAKLPCTARPGRTSTPQASLALEANATEMSTFSALVAGLIRSRALALSTTRGTSTIRALVACQGAELIATTTASAAGRTTRTTASTISTATTIAAVATTILHVHCRHFR